MTPFRHCEPARSGGAAIQSNKRPIDLRRRLQLLATSVLALVGATDAAADDDAFATWQRYGGDAGRTHYSSLDEINRDNVVHLRPAWRFDTGDAEPRSEMQCNPIVVGDTLYATSPKLKVFALNAATGEQRWSFDPFVGRTSGQGVNRGVAYWSRGGDRRILFTAGPHLYALDAQHGRIISTFGDNGRVDLRTGLDRDPAQLQVDATTPGAVFEDLIILGSRVGETPQAAPGHIRAFNVVTGELVWVFRTIPHPGEFGYDTWPADAWREVGGANAWGGLSLDVERGIAFVPTGSPSFDFYGGNRVGDNLFANSVIALDARTGKRLWHYQIVRHDLWDRDLPAAPVLVAVQRDGTAVQAIAQVTKDGHVFVLNRTSGKPLFPVDEQAVPPSAVDGEVAATHQRVPRRPPPFTRQRFSRADVTRLSETSHRFVMDKLDGVALGGPFTPPSDRHPTVLFPGFDGGAEWGGPAFDPETGYLYVNATELPWTYRLDAITSASGLPGRDLYVAHCAACHGLDARGNGKDFPSLLGVGQRLSYPKVAGIIRRGKGRMPGFPQLRFDKILLLLDYLNDPDAREPETGNAANARRTYLHTGYFPLYDQDGYPGIEPPWGTLTAIDLNRGAIAWQRPLGEYPELAAKGIRNTGTETYGGPLVTGGGLLFIAATMDETFRAFDKISGALLWQTELPASGFATPSTYLVDGRQFVVIAAGGGKSGRRSSGQYVAFSLPE